MKKNVQALTEKNRNKGIYENSYKGNMQNQYNYNYEILIVVFDQNQNDERNKFTIINNLIKENKGHKNIGNYRYQNQNDEIDESDKSIYYSNYNSKKSEIKYPIKSQNNNLQNQNQYQNIRQYQNNQNSYQNIRQSQNNKYQLNNNINNNDDSYEQNVNVYMSENEYSEKDKNKVKAREYINKNKNINENKGLIKNEIIEKNKMTNIYQDKEMNIENN